MAVVFLVISLGLILLAAECFTNGIELVGRRLSFSQAVVGSVLAAVGTALPETILPIVAIFSHRNASSHEIGVGAILGAHHPRCGLNRGRSKGISSFSW